MLRILAALVFFAIVARAAPPANYYGPAEGLTGAELKDQLRQIIDGHTVHPYDALPTILRSLWEDPQDASRMRQVYGNTPVAKTAFTWNREHLWPRSRGVNPSTAPDGGPDDSDLFHVVPADSNVNSARSNLYFDLSRVEDGNFRDPAHAEAPLCTRDTNSWQPPPSERGDIARALFYMAVRYDGSEPGTEDLELVTTSPTGAQMANLATLLAWHAADPPDAAEQARNDRIFADYQHNRNPFIDRPEWVSAIWGTLTGAPTVQIAANAAKAFESPGLPVTITVALNGSAPAGGVTFGFSLAGSASGADYVLSGPAVDEVAHAVSIPAGATVVSFTLTATADGVKEAAEALIFTITSPAGYDVIGGPLSISIVDEPTVAREVLASWNFDAASFPPTIPANVGVASVKTSTWTGMVHSFSGVSGQSLALQGSAGNNSYIEITCSTLGWTNLRVAFSTRANESGSFTSGTWSWSADGSQFTNVAAVNTVATGTIFQPRLLDLSGIPALQNQAAVTLRYRLSGASASMANNRIDDLVLTGNRYTEAWIAQYPAFGGSESDPSADPDGDQFDNFREWAFDQNPLGRNPPATATMGDVVAPDPADNDLLKRWRAITFTRRKDTERLLVFPEQSVDLKEWTGGCVLVSTAPGFTAQSETVTYRTTIPSESGPVFIRLRIREE